MTGDEMPSWLDVSVEDEVACVDAGLLSAALDEIALSPARARVVVTAEGDARTVTIQVTQGDTVAWRKEFPELASACPSMPGSIAASVAAAVRTGDLLPDSPESPNFRLGIRTFVPVTASLGLPTWDPPTAALPWQPRFGLGVRLLVDAGPCDLVLGSSVHLGLPFAVGTGSAQVGEGLLSAGIATNGLGKWHVHAGANGGLSVAGGSGFVEDLLRAGPAVSAWTAVGHRVAPWLDAELGVRVNAVRMRVAAVPRVGAGALSVVDEPWIRGELTLVPAVRRTIRRTE